MYIKAVEVVDTLGIEPIQMPNLRRPPKRYTGEANQHIPESPVDFYRAEFYKVLGTLDMQFSERFNQTHLHKLGKLENILLTGAIDEIIDEYPELSMENLKVQLAMFWMKNIYKSSNEAAHILKAMPVEVRGLIDQVEALVRLLLVIPR